MAQSPRPVALVTGASAGIGREFCRQLAAAGYDLVLVARGADRLRLLAGELADRHGTSCEVLAADLASDADVDRIVARIDASPLDLLVNNAGFGTRGSLVRTSREGQEQMLRVHVLAAHRLAQAALQGMVPRGRGAIINVSSVASFLTSPGNVNYAATKAWQRLFIESAALELAGTGVYVQALCPGYTHTEFHDRAGIDKRKSTSWIWMNAERVVAESLRAVRRRKPVVVVPGPGYRAAAFLLRYMPRWAWRLLIRARRPGRPRPGSGAGPS